MAKNKNKRKMVDNKKFLVNDDSPVFKFINPNNNDKLSELSGFDLQDLVILINDYYIQLRNQLGFDKYITFGLEIEFEHAMKDRIDRQLREAFPNNDWRTKGDGSLTRGAEIASPILKDIENDWKNLDKVCSIVEPLASIEKNSGGHIHVGTQALGNKKESWLNFFKLWSVYENIVYRFVYGDFLTARPSMTEYAPPMSLSFWNAYGNLKAEDVSLENIIYKFSSEKYQAINLRNISINDCDKFKTKNTIEFRCPNGSLDSAIWQNNVNLFVRMLLYSKSNFYNDDLVRQRHQLNSDKYAKLKWYDEIYLEQALELCDMIFNNNFDKVYFLRQYLKSFQTCKKSEDYPKARALTKKG